jgi:ATP-dependent Lon protease
MTDIDTSEFQSDPSRDAGSGTELLPLLPLTQGVVFPQMVVTIALETDEAKRAGAAAEQAGRRMVLVPRVDGQFAPVGTIAQIENSGELPNGTLALVVRGVSRARVGTGATGAEGALHVEVELITDPAPTPRARELAKEYRAVVEAILEQRGARRVADVLAGVDDPGQLADMAAYAPDLTMEQRVQLLETIDVEARLELALLWARESLADLELKNRIRSEVTDGIDAQQREMLLRRQMDAIRKELGESGDDAAGEYRTRAAELDLPETVRAAVSKELDKFERMGAQNPEQAWVRNWLDAVLDLPWGTQVTEHGDLDDARLVLDADHDGLDDVKERILEFLAVRVLRRERGLATATSGRGSGAILALVGPPGVGKTSLGESVARALGRPFVRIAVGGVRDEAEIRGHRRTYVGARPGRIVRALTEAKAMNPVVLIDEIDKLQAGGWSGDPASALLEVLDPAQNHTFRDHYLELDLDLSDVLFLATANVLDTIPGPLLDRMELVQLDGYTEDEKVTIAKHHLFPRQREKAGLRDDELELTDGAFHALVAGWTREAGVRNLERQLGKVVRKAARRIATGDVTTGDVTTGDGAKLVVDEDNLNDYVGRPRFHAEDATRAPIPGLATGLAVTGAGGDVLTIEVTGMDGEPGLHVTGQLGDVMSESAQIALSFVRANAAELDVPEGAFDHRRFHLHVPSGAVPKDGPSAGITMTTALASLVTGRPVKPGVGMTGEVTLQGRVLPIGGLKQKVLAAHRAGLTDVVMPADNEPDLDDVPEAVRAAMRFHPVRDVREVLELALT